MKTTIMEPRSGLQAGRTLLGSLLVLLTCAFCTYANGEDGALSKEDAKLLESLIPRPLIDPHGWTLVSVSCPIRNVWTTTETCRRQGWAKPDANGSVKEVVFSDGELIHVSQGADCRICDFVKLCTDIVDEPPRKDDPDSQRIFAQMREEASGLPGFPILAVAAWLHCLGKDALAVKMLAAASGELRNEGDRKKVTVVEQMRRNLAWHAFADLVHAYMVRADDEALIAGRRLLDLYPDVADPQAATLVSEILRRRATHHDDEGIRSAIPAEASSWPVDRQISFLISHLDEVSERQCSQPGGIDLGADPIVGQLIAIGDPAVSALIDVIDTDKRLTRSVHFWRDFAPDRTVVSTREAALAAVMSILRLPIFKAASTGDDFTSHGDQTAHETARQLRTYWDKSRALPLAARLRATLLDATQSWQLRRDAATQLGSLGNDATITTTIAAGRSQPNASHILRESALALRDPTVGEAILQTMDQDLSRTQRDQYDDADAALRIYLDAMIGLRDSRIAGMIAARGDLAKSPSSLCLWARAVDALGSHGLMRKLSAEVAKGTLPLTGNLTSDADLLELVVSTLGDAHDPSGHAALMAIQAPAHPYHQECISCMVGILFETYSPWFSDSFCIGLLADKLDDTGLTNNFCTLQGSQVNLAGQTSGMETLPEGILPTDCLPSVQVRECDAVAKLLSSMLRGVPAYHPLLKDRDLRILRLKDFIKMHGSDLQRLAPPVIQALGLEPFNPYYSYYPQVTDHVSTIADVAAHRAIFALGAGARRADLQLPAVAMYLIPGKTIKGKAPDTEKVLVVQAELDSAGKAHYGIIAREGVLEVDDEQLIGIHPIDDPPQH